MLFWSSSKKLFFLGIFAGIFFFFYSFVFIVHATDSSLDINATVPAICGNGVMEGAEGCDDGNLVSGDACSDICVVEIPGAVCGNGAVEGAEECDDGNVVNGDGCSSICVTEHNGGNNGGGGGQVPRPAPALCGNGAIEGNESCDDGNIVSGDGCSNVCGAEPAPFCGDGVKQGLEQCDDGNIVNGDGCSSQCFFEPVCGNGVVEAGEQCDDANVQSGDGCSNFCQNEVPGALCGNGLVEGAEQCDDGNILNNDGCSKACIRELPMCGNGVVEGAEQCDDGNVNNADGCSALCQVERGICGNGLVEVGEQCDDGNIQNFDGCSNVCANEPAPICGNGIRERGEQCDDGNRNIGDGCSLFCLREAPVIPAAPIENAGGNGGNPAVNPAVNPVVPAGQNNGQGQVEGEKENVVPVEENKNPVEAPKSVFDGVKKTDSLSEKVSVVSGNVGERMIVGVQKFKLAVFASPKIVTDVVTEINKIADDPKVEQVTETVVAPATAALAVAVVAPSLSTVAFPFLRLVFLQPMLLFGRKKRRAWGQIYNSLTKLPVDLAMVRLIDAKTKRVLQSRVTDMQGRYLFIAEEGEYLIEVAKAQFSFPSDILKGEKIDGKMIDLYHGETLSVKGTGISLTPNIPLDPVGAEKTSSRIKWDKYVLGLQHVVASSGIFLTALSLYVSQVWYLWVMLAVHIVMYSLFVKFVKPTKPKGWGIVYEKNTVMPIQNAVVRLFTKKYNKLVSTQVTDRRGRYAFLVGPSDYYVTFDKKGYKTEKTNDITISEQETAAILKQDATLEKQI